MKKHNKYQLAIIMLASCGTALAYDASYIDSYKAAKSYVYVNSWFGSVAEMYSAFLTDKQSSINYDAARGLKTVFSNLRVCADTKDPYGNSSQWITWGELGYHCYDVTSYNISNGSVYSSTIGAALGHLDVSCPAYGSYQLNRNYVNSNAQLGPVTQNPTCDRTAVSQLPKTCSAPGFPQSGSLALGNPIYPLQGEKIESVVDYDNNHDLSVSRTYSSSQGRFVFSFERGILPPAIGAGAFGVYKSIDTNNSNYKFFARVNLDSGKAVYFGKMGDRYDLVFNAAKNGYVSNDGYSVFMQSYGTGWAVKDLNAKEWLTFNSQQQVTSIRKFDGSTVNYTYSSAATAGVAPAAGYVTSISDAFGRTLSLTYDSTGMIATIRDPNSKIISFSSKTSPGNLAPVGTGSPLSGLISSVTYQDGAITSYGWDEPAWSTLSGSGKLTSITDANNILFANFGYKNDKATSSQHAGGVYKYSFDYSTNPIVMTDPLGTTSKLTTTSINGGTNILTDQSQESGSGCVASSSNLAYDTNNNLVSSTDFNKNKTCYSFDSTRTNPSIRIEGLDSGASCASFFTSPPAVLPTGARKISTKWHPDWNIEATRTEPGKIISYVYNGQPDPFGTLVNGKPPILNCITPATDATAAVFPDNTAIAVLCKKVEQATTDTTGASGINASIDAAVTQRVESWTYNKYGQVLTRTGPRTNSSETYEYYLSSSAAGDYATGDLKSIKDAAGNITDFTKYDKHGQVLTMTDPNSVSTTFTYDLRQRIETVSVGSSTTSYDYYPTGQLKQVTKPDGSYVAYSYDDAHRIKSAVDNFGNSVTYELDNIGNIKRTQVYDPSGAVKRESNRNYDALGRLKATTGLE